MQLKGIVKTKNSNEVHIKTDELQRIKAAFIEGYVTGNNQKPQGRAFKVLRFTQQIVSTLLLVVLLVGLMGAY